MTAMSDKTDPLPEPAGVIIVGTQALRAFTADQMHAYASAAEQRAAAAEAEAEALRRDAEHWRANHDNQLELKRRLSERYGNVVRAAINVAAEWERYRWCTETSRAIEALCAVLEEDAAIAGRETSA
jgi:hypothetical protein